jgi:DNA-binding HxlR family transcriptional regulator
MKRDLPDITPRALSLKLVELQEHGLIEKEVKPGTPVIISYVLTDKGRTLTEALRPVQQWAQQYRHHEKGEDRQ